MEMLRSPPPQKFLLRFCYRIATRWNCSEIHTFQFRWERQQTMRSWFFYRPTPALTGKRGTSRKRGDKLQPNDPSSQFDPGGQGEALDAAGKSVVLTRFGGDEERTPAPRREHLAQWCSLRSRSASDKDVAQTADLLLSCSIAWFPSSTKVGEFHSTSLLYTRWLLAYGVPPQSHQRMA